MQAKRERASIAARAVASASSSFAGSPPPACAASSRPPPPPPIAAGALADHVAGACRPRSTAALVKLAASTTFSPSAPPSTTARLAELGPGRGRRGPSSAFASSPSARAATTLHAVDLHGLRHELLRRLAGLAAAGLGHLPLQLGQALGGPARRRPAASRGEPSSAPASSSCRAALAEPVDRRRAGDRLDPPHVGGARALADDREDPDLGRVRRRGSRRRARARRRRPRPRAPTRRTSRRTAPSRPAPRPRRGPSASRARGGCALIQPFTRSSTSRSSSGRQRGAVREVEAQLVGAHRRARLAHVVAEALAQRRVQQVGGGVVSHRRVARLVVDHRLDRRARARGRRRARSAWSSPIR